MNTNPCDDDFDMNARFYLGTRKRGGLGYKIGFEVICYDRVKKKQLPWRNERTRERAEEMALMLANDAMCQEIWKRSDREIRKLCKARK